MKQKKLTLFIIAILLIVIQGCSLFKSTPSAPPLQRMTMQFDYQPPIEGYSKSNSISFILLSPKFAKDEENSNQEPFISFSKNMAKDFEEMMTQRGYTYTGPYDTYDELVYSEKKNADFILEVEIDYTWQGAQDAVVSKTKSYYDYASKKTISTTYYGFNGNITLGGKLNLTLVEPQTKTKLWVKSVAMPNQTFLFKSEEMYTSLNYVDYNDVGLFNSIVPQLEIMYDKAMQLAWNHLDPEELKIKQKEADEIRNDAGFKKN